MGDQSSIEWTDASWNMIRAAQRVGEKIGWICVRVSDGCRNCYARTMNGWRGNGADYSVPGLALVDPFLDEKALLLPLRWRDPRKVFVCSMTDLFGEWVLDEWIDRIFAVMALAPRHTFQVLTKRPERMRDYLTYESRWAQVEGQCDDLVGSKEAPALATPERTSLPNVHLGVSVENQSTADERIPLLLATPAAVRFLSVEPLLGPVDLTRIPWGGLRTNILRGWTGPEHGLHWVIVGGESGPDARPMHPAWARSVRDHCVAAGVPFFFKQWGQWAPTKAEPVRGKHAGGGIYLRPDGIWGNQGDWWDGKAAGMDKVGKKAAGALLDGREWREFPR